MDVAVLLENPIGSEPHRLERAIHIGRHHEMPRRHRPRPVAQHPVAHMRLGLAIQVLAVTVECPRHLGLLIKPVRLRHLLERNLQLLERRIRAPESLTAPEVWQSRVDAHPGTRRDQQRIRFRDQRRRPSQVSLCPITGHRMCSLVDPARLANRDSIASKLGPQP